MHHTIAVCDQITRFELLATRGVDFVGHTISNEVRSVHASDFIFAPWGHGRPMCVYQAYGTRYTVGKGTSALRICNIEAIRFEAPMLL
jgi:hypothetical protein